MATIKVVVLGDGAVGKTSIVNSYAKDYAPDENMAIAVSARRCSRLFNLEICDSAGEKDYENLSSFCYSNTKVFLFCFSIVDPVSLENLKVKWFPKVRFYCPNASIVLVGTKSDLRKSKVHIEKLKRTKQSPVSAREGKQMAKQLGAFKYLECSAMIKEGLENVFDTAVQSALMVRK